MTNPLAVIKNQVGTKAGVLNGSLVRVFECDADRGTARVVGSDSLAALYGTSKFYIKQENLQLVTTGERLLGPMTIKLNDWGVLNEVERVSLVRNTLKNSKSEFYEDFEGYIIKPQSMALLTAFIEKTAERKATHNHYGSKAIFEELRWHTELKDGCALFKVNNNYTASLSRLVEEMIPETYGFFFKRELKLVGAA